ncbi:hypothetical protein QN360_11480, partial [Glaciimonas sp. CA11.2]|uniref:hypothetical protein n=1 Tax=Glaciimonas sp. CA11.2 TaxID=3048601 RepID=UPI002B2222AB
MALIPTIENNEERLAATALSNSKATSIGKLLSLKHLAKSRTFMLTLLTVLMLIMSSASVLMRPS